MPPAPATKPTDQSRGASPPPTRVPGNLWTEIEAPEPGAFSPDQTVSVVVAGRDPDGVGELTLAALSAQSYPASLTEVVATGGAGATEMEAAERAGGDVLVFLAAGTIPVAGLIEAHARWHHAVSDAVSVGRSRAVDARSLAAQEVADAARRDELEALLAARLRPDDEAGETLEAYLELTRGLTERRVDGFRVAARTNVALRRETFRAAGRSQALSDERLARLDLAYRLERLGCVFVPERAAESFNHYPDAELALQGATDDAEHDPKRGRDPRAESLIPVPGFRPRGSGRLFERPAMVVHVRAGEEGAAEVLETVDAVLRGRLSDLELRLELPPDHPERPLIEEACSADPRIVVEAPGAGRPADSPYEVALPAIAVPDERTFEDLHELMVEEGVGALHVTVPGRLARFLPERSGRLRKLWSGTTVEVVATGPLERARRLAEDARSATADATAPDPVVLLGQLFGERWVSGVEVSLRRRGAPEPQVTEHGPLAPATDLARERAEHLRHRARAATNQARADGQAQRSVRERTRANHERLRADRLEARLARMSPLYWVRWRARWFARRAAALPGAVAGAVGSLRQAGYRARQLAGAAVARSRR